MVTPSRIAAHLDTDPARPEIEAATLCARQLGHDVTDPQVLRAVVNAGHQLRACKLDAYDAGITWRLAEEVGVTVEWWLAELAKAKHFRRRPRPRAS